MNAPIKLTPPLSPSDIAVQTGRMMDVCMEAAKEARELYPPTGWDKFGISIANPLFGPAYRFLRAQKMHRAGLPSSLLGDGRTASERHFEMLDELTKGRVG